MRPILDISGQRFGSLVALSVQKREGRRPLWFCRCDCGGSAVATNGDLRSERRISCAECSKKRTRDACLAAGFGAKGAQCVNFKHGGARRGRHSKEYRTWASMIRRCVLPSQQGFKHYGGRGISVCPEWRADFSAFMRDMGAAPSDRHTLDRIDTNGHYERGNCRWATTAQQAVNRRNNNVVTFAGESLAMSEWASRIGLKYQTLWARIEVHKWPLERALRP